MATTEELQTRLTEAETALHRLMTGQSTARISYDGRDVEYTRAKVGDLRAYISELKSSLGLTGGRKKAILARF